MESELKELLKPPFTFSNFHIYDNEGLNLEFSGICKNYELLRSFGGFVEQALNNEWERKYGEPLKWIYVNDPKWGGHLACPKCGDTERFLNKKEYCPSCGQRLLPPEKEK